MLNKFFGLILFIIFALNPIFAFAQSKEANTPATRFEKLTTLYKHWNVYPEPAPLLGNATLQDAQNLQGFESILQFIDPNGELKKYATWNSSEVRLFLDRDAKTKTDLVFTFNQAGKTKDVQSLVHKFRGASIFNSSSTPLAGLRIALDPGHMGGSKWDRLTGKFVSVLGGYASEGEMAFHTAVLLKQKLENLGATVLITRSADSAATNEDLKTYEIAAYAFKEILSKSDEPWFDQMLLGLVFADAGFLKKANANAEIQKRRGESQRAYYFVHRADLLARVNTINAFNPHMTIVIHFDASRPTLLQNSANGVKAYVPGNVMAGELAAKEERQMILRHLLDGQRWLQSVEFSSAIVKAMSKSLGLSLETSQIGYNAYKVVDGVYTRNLALNRNTTAGVQTFLECLHYDHVLEFQKLSKKDKHVDVDGYRFSYSSRIDAVVEGIVNGVLEYVWNI